MLVWLCFSPVTSRVSPRRASYFFLLRQKKVTKKKASHVRAAYAVPCATRSVRGTCKLASLELSTPLNRLRRFPLQGTTPAARQSRFRGVPGRGCASLASPRLLVRCAHIAGLGCLIPLPSLLSRARHAVPLHQTPSFLTHHFSSWATTRVAPTPSFLIPHSSFLTPHPSPLTPHPSPLTPHPSPLTPHPSPLTPHSSLLTPHSSLLTPHSSSLKPQASVKLAWRTACSQRCIRCCARSRGIWGSKRCSGRQSWLSSSSPW